MEKERMHSLNEAITEAIYERMDDIGTYKVIINNRYIEAEEKITELRKSLKASLTGEQQELLMQLENAYCSGQEISETIRYRQGIRDGLALLKTWGGAF